MRKPKMIQRHVSLTENGVRLLNNHKLANAVIEAFCERREEFLTGKPIAVTSGKDAVKVTVVAAIGMLTTPPGNK